jgi:hypothetical protein
MKKFLFVLMALIAVSASAFAAHVTISLVNGQKLEGKYISYSDTALVILYSSLEGAQKEMTITPQYADYFRISGIGDFVVEDGKFVPVGGAKAKIEKEETDKTQKIEQKRVLSADPNKVIGDAFKSTGKVCFGVGVPAAVVGAILMGYGYGTPTGDNAKELAANTQSRSRCAAAGTVLVPVGATLTIVGIPLYIHGKRIGELNFNYTGNGAGVAYNF